MSQERLSRRNLEGVVEGYAWVPENWGSEEYAAFFEYGEEETEMIREEVERYFDTSDWMEQEAARHAYAAVISRFSEQEVVTDRDIAVAVAKEVPQDVHWTALYDVLLSEKIAAHRDIVREAYRRK